VLSSWASLSMGGWSLCHASLVFRVRGRVRVLGLGFCVRVRVSVSVTGSVSYLNENCSLHDLLLSAPAIHRQSFPLPIFQLLYLKFDVCISFHRGLF